VLNVDAEADRRDFTVRASLEVADGERIALFGPSGAGKTTVLEMIAGLVAPARGRIELGGRVLTATAGPAVAVPPWQRRVGLLRQDPGLFPHLTVRANLTYAWRSGSAGAGSGSGGGRAGSGGSELAEIASSLGIDGLMAAMPARLSGGQRHRVALGRLLLAHCDALLFDEPFASLDAALRRSLTALVKDLSSQRSVPSVLVTHQLSDAQAFADRLLVMDRGAILQAGAPNEVVLRPASRRVAELVGYLGFVPAVGSGSAGSGSAGSGSAGSGSAGSGSAGSGGAGPGAVASGAAESGLAGAGVVAGVHPDRVVPGADPARGLVVTGTVAEARPSGAGWEADVLVGDAPFTCRLPSRPDGAQLSVTVLDPPYFGPDGALRETTRTRSSDKG
jgi:molybdate transport system ATP-binding protein